MRSNVLFHFRYSKEGFCGAKVCASKPWAKGMEFKALSGQLVNINQDEEEYLARNNLDFSLFYGRTKRKLWLGPGSFVNHDCKPNSAYLKVNKNMYLIKAQKNISVGEEILVCYGTKYFDKNTCECSTCDFENGYVDTSR